MKLLFHCGFHKTGTSSFQELLRSNAGRGPARTLFLTIRDPAVRRLNTALRVCHHAPVAPGWLLLKRALTGLRDTIHASGATTALVSFERICGKLPNRRGASLYPHGRKTLALLANVFRDDELSFLFSTREPGAWVRSLHGHRMNTRKHVMPLEQFAGLPKFASIDWKREIADMTGELGVPVHVTSLETSARLPLGPCSDFLALVDPAPDAFAAWKPVAPRNVGKASKTTP